MSRMKHTVRGSNPRFEMIYIRTIMIYIRVNDVIFKARRDLDPATYQVDRFDILDICQPGQYNLEL